MLSPTPKKSVKSTKRCCPKQIAYPYSFAFIRISCPTYTQFGECSKLLFSPARPTPVAGPPHLLRMNTRTYTKNAATHRSQSATRQTRKNDWKKSRKTRKNNRKKTPKNRMTFILGARAIFSNFLAPGFILQTTAWKNENLYKIEKDFAVNYSVGIRKKVDIYPSAY